MRAVPTNRYVSFVAIAGLGCAADLATKQWIFARLGAPGGATWWLWGDMVGLQTSLNYGALWGLGQGQGWFFASLSILAALGILVWLFLLGAAQDRLLNGALASIMGGILGNLYDRLGLWSTDATPQYAVRDWILLQYGHWVWPNFNIADSMLVCGAALLVIHALFHQPETTSAARLSGQDS
jgi:signal peptidase II